VLAVAGVALAGPLHLRARVAGAYRCAVPLAIQRAVKGGPSWPAVPASPARDALRSVSTRLTDLNTRAFVVLVDGRTVFEAYERCHGPFTPHYTASAAKALVGGLVAALALDSAWIDLDAPAATLIPALEAREDVGPVTLRHLGTHASGFDEASVGDEYGPGLPGWKGRFWSAPETSWQVALTETPVRFESGTQYLYSNPAMAILGYSLSSALAPHTDVGLDHVLREGIMQPAGIADDEWSISDHRSYPMDGLSLYRIGGGGEFSARALTALGQLLLDEGRAGDRQLVSPESLAAVTTYAGTPPLTTLKGNPAPGIGWHTNAAGTFPSLPDDAFLAAGAEHQVLLIVPSAGLVVVRNGGSLGGPKWGPGYWSRLEAEIFAPVMSALNAN